MSFIGKKGAERLDQSNPTLGLLDAHTHALQLLRLHTDMHTIKQQTGWEVGVDGKWRYEVEDPFLSTAEIEDHIKRHHGERIDIRFCMRDTALLVAYPAFERLQLFTKYSATYFAGYFNPVNYGMVVCMGTLSCPFEEQTEGVLLHEVQHLIQEEENFARGSDTSEGWSRYKRSAGEVESRNVCLRHFLSPQQRRSMLYSDTQDVPDEKQIILFL